MSDVMRTALRELEAQRDKLNTAIAAISGLLGEPAPEVVRPRSQQIKAPRAAAGLPDGADAILRALDRGPMKSSDIEKATGISLYNLKRHFKALTSKNLIHRTGATSTSRWHLGAAGARRPTSSAKEEP